MESIIISFLFFYNNIYLAGSAEYGECVLGQCYPKSSDIKDGDTFDYLIIGAGTAGCILATRLTELKKATVLLIEAGGDPPIESVIPALSLQMHLTAVDWNYKTVNDSYSSQSLNNGQVTINRGKMLGGSGSMNWMVHTRGNQHDYNEVWYNDIGSSEWKYQNVLPYFKKLENVTDERILRNPGSGYYRGTRGPIEITNTDNSPNVTALYLKGLEEVGIYFNKDFNAESQMGSGIVDTNIYGGIRQSSLIAYLNPIVERGNLYVLKKSYVTKIIIDKKTKTALGVEIKTESGEIISTYASKEVIVSAGTINTPQLLMLSGIGPRQHLSEYGIDCLVDLPVGKNLHDHLAVPLFLYFDKEIQGVFDQEAALAEYLENRTGILASTSSNTVASFISLTDESFPDFQTVILHFSKNSTDPMSVCNVTGFKEEICRKTFSTDKEISFFCMSMVRTESRGQILLASEDPTVHPRIYSGYFSEDGDLERAALAVEELVKVVATEAFQKYGPSFFNLDIEECIEFTPYSHEFWKCYCLATATTSWHPVGTAKMGKIGDVASVVDTNFKVIGIHSLRVIDGSAISTIPSADINNVVGMFAEKGADKIKEDYFCRR